MDTTRPAAPAFALNSVVAIAGVAVLAALVSLPVWGDDYFVVIGTRILVYWCLISGLNLVVGFAGQLAIGYVAVLAVGGYTASALCFHLGLDPFLSMAAAAALCALAGLIVGIPALRLRTFYFAVATLGAAQIVTQIAFSWTSVTGGGIGIPGPMFPGALGSVSGLYYVCMVAAILCTWLTTNLAFSRYGRELVALRDAGVAAASCGLSNRRSLVPVLIFAGALAGVAGTLYASVQTYITPEAFNFDLSLLFFVAILVGGRGTVLGPALATVILTILPELSVDLAAWSTLIHAALLLGITLLVPGGIGEGLRKLTEPPLPQNRAIRIRPELARDHDRTEKAPLETSEISISFGGLKAVDAVSLSVVPGEVHGLIGPNGSGKTTTLNVICGFNTASEGVVRIGSERLAGGVPQEAAAKGIARTFQTPKVVGEATVLQNVLIGAQSPSTGFVSAALGLPAQRQDERAMRERGMAALRTVGLDGFADLSCERLQHSELRFLEIARALMMEPRFLLLDEPAAGLSRDEIERLDELIAHLARDAGIGILMVEHHADLIFKVCDRITVLNLGTVLASGTADEVRTNKEVQNAYLGTG